MASCWPTKPDKGPRSMRAFAEVFTGPRVPLVALFKGVSMRQLASEHRRWVTPAKQLAQRHFGGLLGFAEGPDRGQRVRWVTYLSEMFLSPLATLRLREFFTVPRRMQGLTLSGSGQKCLYFGTCGSPGHDDYRESTLGT